MAMSSSSKGVLILLKVKKSINPEVYKTQLEQNSDNFLTHRRIAQKALKCLFTLKPKMQVDKYDGSDVLFHIITY